MRNIGLDMHTQKTMLEFKCPPAPSPPAIGLSRIGIERVLDSSPNLN